MKLIAKTMVAGFIALAMVFTLTPLVGGFAFANDDEGDDGGDITVDLTVEDPDDILINDWVTYSAEASEDVDYIRVYPSASQNSETGEWSGEWWRQRDGRSISSDDERIFYDETGNYHFVAIAYSCGEDLEDESDDVALASSDPIEVIVTSNGEAGAFTVKKVGDENEGVLETTVSRGDTIDIECNDSEHANHYWIDVQEFDENNNGEWIEHHLGDTGDTTVSLNTISLEPGTYCLWAAANAPGYTDRYATEPIKVTVEDLVIPDGKKMFFTTSKTAVTTCEEVTIGAYCPEAEWIKVYMDYAGNRMWNIDNHGSGNGSVLDDSNAYGNSGTYKLVAEAYQYDEENEKDVVIDSSEIEITVTAAEDEEFVIETDPEIPAYIKEETDTLDFVVTKPEHADGIRVNSWFDSDDDNDDNDLYHRETGDATLSVSIPVSNLEEGETLRIQIETWGYGYETAIKEYRIAVVENISETDDVTLTVSDEDILVNEEVTVTVKPKDGVELETIQFFDGYGFWDEEEPDENGSFSRDIDFGESGSFSVFAKVLLEDGDDWVICAPVSINVTSSGRVGEFAITKVSLSGEEKDFTNPISITRGDAITIKYSEASNADRYWVEAHYYNEDWGDWDWYDGFENSESDTICFNTIGLEPGRYLINVKGSGIGYESNNSGNSFELIVSDLEIPEGEEMYFAVSDSELETCEEFTFAAYHPDAEWIEIFMDYGNNRDWSRDNDEGNYFYDQDSYGNSGVYQLVAIAYGYDENDEEKEIARASHTVNVTASAGDLTINMPELPSYIVEGDDDPLAFTINKPEHADSYKVDVWYESDDEDEGDLFHEDSDDDSINVNVGISKIAEGATICINVEAWGRNYEGTKKEVRIPVVAQTSDAVAITADLEENEDVWINEEVEFTVSAGGAEIDKVIFYNGEGFWDEEDPDEDDNTKFTARTDFNRVGSYSVYAKVLLAGSDEWSTCKPVTITVKSHGKVGAFAINKVGEVEDFEEPITVTRGEAIVVLCSEAENANHYWLDAEQYDTDNEGWEYYDSFANSRNATINFNTIELEPGTYRINAQANGSGYEQRGSSNSFELTVGDLEISENEMYLQTSKTTVETCEDFTFYAYHPDADYIEVYPDYDNNKDWCNDSGGRNIFDGGNSYRDSGTYNFVAIAYKEAEEETEDIEIARASEPITVTAPKGELDITMPDLPSSLKAGTDDLSFTASKPANADGIRVNIWYDFNDDVDDHSLCDEETEDDTLTATATTSMLEEGAIVCVRVEAWGRGYEQASAGARIPMIATPSAKVKITANKSEAQVNENVTVKVETVDASDEIEKVQLFGGYGFRDEDDPDDDGAYTRLVIFNDTGSHTVYARVLLAGSDDWVTCDPVTVITTSLGQVGTFEVTKVNGETDLDLDVAKGDTIIIETSGAEHATGYWAEIQMYDKAEDEWEWCGRSEGTDNQQITVDTDDFDGDSLDAGEYVIRIFANGVGYEEREADTEITLRIHELTSHAAVAATCTQNGNNAYWECDDCGKYFADRDGEADLKQAINENSWVIQKKPHDPTHYAAKGKTCTEPGNIEYWQCETCHKYFSDANAATEINQSDTVIPASHNLTSHAAKAKTCTEPGNKKYWYCEDCHKYFSDANGKTEIQQADTVIPPAHTEQVMPAKAATCTESGLKEGVKCADCGEILIQQEVVPAAHSFSDWVVMSSECSGDATWKQRECGKCGYIDYEGDVASGHDWDTEYSVDVEPKCGVNGSKSIHCKKCGVKKDSQVIPALEHEYNAVVTKPSCTEKGFTTHTCTRCKDSYVDTYVDALGHDYAVEVEGTAKEATCTEAGKKVNIKCSRCDSSIEGETIPALGHDPVKVARVEPTTKKEGTEAYWKCSRCGKLFSDEACQNEIGAPVKIAKLKMGADGTALGKGASAAAAEKAITTMKNDSDPKGAAFIALKLRSTKQAKNSITLNWAKAKGATKYVIYGNMCGKANKMKKIVTVTKNTYTVKKAVKNLVKGKYYKFIIVALDKKGTVVSTSKVIHVATAGTKIGNHKSVTVTKKVITNAAKLKKGKTLRLGAKPVPVAKKKVTKHVGVRYESTNKKIATVSATGVVKGVKKGTCYVYAYAQNGVFRAIKVVVK